jgi:hypothetical protein
MCRDPAATDSSAAITIKNLLCGNRVMEGSEDHPCYCSFEDSALASFRIGMSMSASFQRLKKS